MADYYKSYAKKVPVRIRTTGLPIARCRVIPYGHISICYIDV